MRKVSYQPVFILSLAIVIGIILSLPGFTGSNDERFAIYLTEDDVSPAKLSILSHVDIAEQPIIDVNDVVSYNANTHEITLTPDAFERVFTLQVPVSGKSFAVCVDKQPIYCGAFWTPISSISFDGVTIWQPFGSQESKVVRLELGYPSSSFYGGGDPRVNPRIFNSLEQAGKLVRSQSQGDVLPDSLKGYELYSWLEDDQWHFTLVTGTNRGKTLEEVSSTSNIVSEDGWVQVHVIGVSAIKTVLSRLPHSEDVFWQRTLNPEQKPQASIILKIPEGPALEAIMEHSEKCGLNLQILS